ncbi:MAG: sigma-70 family RNA polymerase sigma factor [Cyanobacteria bacterium J06592_8]
MTTITYTSPTSQHSLKQTSLDLLQEYKQFPRKSIRNKIVQLNMGLVRREVHRWTNKCSESFDDLLQVGSLGLIKAIERFDLTKGYALSSFAMPYIRGEILHYLRDKSLPIRIPRQYTQLKTQAQKVRLQLREQLHRQPTDLEIAETLGISIDKWNQVRLAENNCSLLSLDMTCLGESDQKNSLGESIIDPNFSQLKANQEEQLSLEIALSQLQPENRYILESVFFKNSTYKEVAKQLGVSMITVSRRVKKSLKELKLLL